MLDHIKISQYEILNLFVVTNYTCLSRNIMLEYIRVEQNIPRIQFIYEGKKSIIHMINIKKRLLSNHMTFLFLGWK